jgi:acyl-coenzyme A thioesterase PaaI-like protein
VTDAVKQNVRNGHATGRLPDDGPEREAMHLLADQLRALATAIFDRNLPIDVAHHASAVVQALTNHVSAAPLRDYDSPTFDSSGFLDFSPVSGLASPVSPPVRLASETDGSVSGTAVFSDAFEGPPGHVHGGVLSAAFDEVLGLAQTASGHAGMTGRLTVHYRKPTPTNVEVRFSGRIDSISGRKIVAKGESRVLLNGEWVVTAESEGLFVSMPEGFRTLSGGSRF